MSLRDEMKEGIRQVLLGSRNHDDGTLVAGEDYINTIAPEIADVVFKILGMDEYQQDLEY